MMQTGVVRISTRLSAAARAVRGVCIAVFGSSLLVWAYGCGPQLVESRQGPPPGSPILSLPAQSVPAAGPAIPGAADHSGPPSSSNIAGIPEMPASSVLPRSPAARRAEYYEVQAGDSLSTIARRFDTTVDRLVNDNGLTQDSLLQPGQRLFIREMSE